MTFKALRTVRNDAGHRSTHWVELNVDDLAAGDVVIRSHYAAVNYKDARAVSGKKTMMLGLVSPGMRAPATSSAAGSSVGSGDGRSNSGQVRHCFVGSSGSRIGSGHSGLS